MTNPPGLRPALCLDLDGTVRGSRSGAKYGPATPDDVVLLPNTEPTVARYKAAGWAVVGVSNQGVVAFGTKTVTEVEAILAATRAAFQVDPFDIVLMSYAHPDAVGMWGARSLCRKPGTGMLGAAEILAQQGGWMIDWKHSIFVGDRPEDAGCAAGAGVTFMGADDFFRRTESPQAPPGVDWIPELGLYLVSDAAPQPPITDEHAQHLTAGGCNQCFIPDKGAARERFMCIHKMFHDGLCRFRIAGRLYDLGADGVARLFEVAS